MPFRGSLSTFLANSAALQETPLLERFFLWAVADTVFLNIAVDDDVPVFRGSREPRQWWTGTWAVLFEVL
jgi:hypothetical protein